mmetsp:Transcript_29841/g.43900  ORF Transcript_29841/g.43900 Transcript_29841/m.43900 type:complete len:247 (-) Transcript_29841:167-907(-)
MSCVAAIWNFTMLPSPLFLLLSLILLRSKPSAITFIFNGGSPSQSIISSKSSSASESLSVRTSSSSSRAAARASVSNNVSSGIPGRPTASTCNRSISPIPLLPRSFSNLNGGIVNISPSDRWTGTLASSSIGLCDAANDTRRLGCAGTDSRRTTICCSSCFGALCVLRWYTDAGGGIWHEVVDSSLATSSASDFLKRIGNVRLRQVTHKPATSNVSASGTVSVSVSFSSFTSSLCSVLDTDTMNGK